MNLRTHPQRLEKFLTHGQSMESLPANTTTSLPLLTKRGDQIYQANFYYLNEFDEENMIPRPFAWSLLPFDDSPTYLFNWCHLSDFISTQKYPLNSRVSAKLPIEGLTEETYEEYVQELWELVLELHTFAFTSELTDVQKQVVDHYKDLFSLIVYPGLYPYYHAIAPEFFQWLGLTPIVRPQPEITLKGVEQRLDRLSLQFQEKIATDNQKQVLFDEIHEELQRYKTGAYEELAHVVERDVILIIDTILKNIEAIKDQPINPAGYQQLLDFYNNVQEDLTDLLYRQGIDPYILDGNMVQFPKQKILSTIPTDDPILDKTIAAHVAPGWGKGDQIVRPEHVRVYLYQPEPPWEQEVPQGYVKELLTYDE